MKHKEPAIFLPGLETDAVGSDVVSDEVRRPGGWWQMRNPLDRRRTNSMAPIAPAGPADKRKQNKNRCQQNNGWKMQQGAQRASCIMMMVMPRMMRHSRHPRVPHWHHHHF